jgi:hypothetical protein
MSVNPLSVEMAESVVGLDDASELSVSGVMKSGVR